MASEEPGCQAEHHVGKKEQKKKKISLPADAVCNNCPSKIDNYKADHIASVQQYITMSEMASELGPLHLTQTNSPKERGASHIIRAGVVQPRHPSVVFRIRTRSMLYGIYYVQADTMDQVRDTCICKSGFEMTLPSEMSAT